ncbi:MAG: ABC transporter permease [Ruminiclostridium sp.]|nr:ABC transporter permease [Ruminiclostridium sp.]
MEGASFSIQTSIYFKKIARIAIRENVWKFFIFSVIISFLVAAVVGEKMFTTFDSTKSGFFSITSSSIWIGIFNSIQSVCKEHDTIRDEYRSGARLSSYVTANVLWQLVVCFLQSVIILVVCTFFVDFNSDGVIFPAILEYFITIFLLVFCADIMGIMISSIASTSTTAMTIMPFVLIIQLIMSGVLFKLEGWSEKISCITFSKWGMSAFGATAEMNSDDLPLAISEAFPNVFRIEKEAYYDSTVENILTAWGCCILIAIVCYFLSILSLKIKNKGS